MNTLPTPSSLAADAEKERKDREKSILLTERGSLTERMTRATSRSDGSIEVAQPTWLHTIPTLKDELIAAGWQVEEFFEDSRQTELRVVRKAMWKLTPSPTPATPDPEPQPLPQRGDFYLHRKTGNAYIVLTLAKHTETGEIEVIYDRADETQRGEIPHMRPLTMFTQILDDGHPRFALIAHNSDLVAEMLAHAAKAASEAAECNPQAAWEDFVANSPRMQAVMGVGAKT